ITSLYQLRPHFKTPKSSRGVGFLVFLTHLSYRILHDPPNILRELPHPFVGELRVIFKYSSNRPRSPHLRAFAIDVFVGGQPRDRSRVTYQGVTTVHV